MGIGDKVFVPEKGVVLRPDVIHREAELGHIVHKICLIIILLQNFGQVHAGEDGVEKIETVFQVVDEDAVLFVQTAGVFQQSGRFAEGLGAGKLLHERVGLLEAQFLPEGGRLAELGFGAEGHGAGGHLGHPLFHPAEGAVLEGGEHSLFFQPGVKDGVDDPVHDLFVSVQVGL